MLHAPTQTRLGLATRYGAGDARCRHRSEKIANAFEFRRSVRWTEPRRPNLCHDFLENVRSKVAHIDECSVWLSPSRDDLQTCSQRRFQHQSPLWDRCLGHGANLFHDAFYKVVEDLQLAVERPNELFIRLNSHDNLGKHVMPADDIDQLRWET